MTEIERLGDLLQLDFEQIKERFPRGELDQLTGKAIDLAGDLVGDLVAGTWYKDMNKKYMMLNEYLGRKVEVHELVELQNALGSAEVDGMKQDYYKEVL